MSNTPRATRTVYKVMEAPDYVTSRERIRLAEIVLVERGPKPYSHASGRYTEELGYHLTVPKDGLLAFGLHDTPQAALEAYMAASEHMVVSLEGSLLKARKMRGDAETFVAAKRAELAAKETQ